MPRAHRNPALSGGLNGITHVTGPHPTGRPSEALRTFPGYTPRRPAGGLGVRNPIGRGYYEAPPAAPTPIDRSLTCRPGRVRGIVTPPRRVPTPPRTPSAPLDPRVARYLRTHPNARLA